MVLHNGTKQFLQFGGVKRHKIQRDIVARSEIVASTAGFSDDSSHALAGFHFCSVLLVLLPLEAKKKFTFLECCEPLCEKQS